MQKSLNNFNPSDIGNITTKEDIWNKYSQNNRNIILYSRKLISKWIFHLKYHFTISARRHNHWSIRQWRLLDEASSHTHAGEWSQEPGQNGCSVHRSAGAPPTETGAMCGSDSHSAQVRAGSTTKPDNMQKK